MDDDEILRLHEEANATYRRMDGSSSPNMAVGEKNLGVLYANRANRAQAANDLDRCLVNLELSLTHHREAARIFRAINRVECIDPALYIVAQTEKQIRQIGIARAAATTTTRG